MFWEDEIFEEIARMRKRLDRLMQSLLPSEELGSFPVDISETTDELIVRAELPGFAKEEINIRASDNTLEIFAEHKEKKVEKGEKFFRAERKYGAYRRLITLPVEVDLESAKSKLKDGVLEIRFKKTGKKLKKIEIE